MFKLQQLVGGRLYSPIFRLKTLYKYNACFYDNQSIDNVVGCNKFWHGCNLLTICLKNLHKNSICYILIIIYLNHL